MDKKTEEEGGNALTIILLIAMFCFFIASMIAGQYGSILIAMVLFYFVYKFEEFIELLINQSKTKPVNGETGATKEDAKKIDEIA